MTFRPRRPALAARLALAGTLALAAGPALAAIQTAGDPPAPSAPSVRGSILPGTGLAVTPPARPAAAAGDVTLNYPRLAVGDLARIVLGDLLHLDYSVAPDAKGEVSLVTERPVARAAILGLFEESLRGANLALVRRSGALVIQPLASARQGGASAEAGEAGFGAETLALKFVSPSQLKKLLDPVVPGAIVQADDARAIVVISGDGVQRKAVRDLAAQFDVDWLKGSSFALFVPQHTDSRLIVPELEKLVNAPSAPTAGLVRLVAMDRLNGILAVAPQAQLLDDVRRWLEVLDREGESTERRLFVYKVQNGRAADLAKTLISAFGGGGAGRGGPAGVATAGSGLQPAASAAASIAGPVAGVDAAPSAAAFGASPVTGGGGTLAISPDGGATISSDEGNNALVLYVTPREYAIISDALRKLDVRPLQVMIEAAITEVQLTDGFRFGVAFAANAGPNTYTLSQDDTGIPYPIFPGFSYMTTKLGSITATLNALSNLTRVDVLSAPKLMVLNNHTASLQVGAQVPVATGSSVSTIGSNAPIVNSIEYRDTGVILKITPRVNAGGLVLLDIYQEVSDVNTTDTSKLNSPTINQRRITSSIAVQDGQTIALGGLIRDNRSRGRTGVPGLSAIPILGAFLGERRNTGDRTELLVLLTPRVVSSVSEAQSVTDDLRAKIQSIRPIKPIDALRP